MPTLKIEIDFESKLSNLSEDREGERVLLPTDKIISFITGGVGDLYIKLLIPHDGVMMELHAQKSSMMKKGAIWDMMPAGSGGLMVRVKGIFKVNAYSHVADRIKESKGPIYIAGIYAGEWPATGGDIMDYDKAKQTSKVVAKLSE